MTDTMIYDETAEETQEGYILNELPDLTINSLYDLFGQKTTPMITEAAKITPDIQNNGVIRFQPADGLQSEAIEIPASVGTVEHLATWLDIPRPFMRNSDPDVQDTLFRLLLAKQGMDPFLVRYNDDGVAGIRDPNKVVVDPRAVVEMAARVVGEDAQVVNAWTTSKEYQFEVIVREGEPQERGDRKVGDLSRGGLRFGQDTQHNLSPWVQQYVYRLICTNGMELPSNAYKVDARQLSSADEMIEHLEAMAQEAFDSVGHQIDAFYDLRNEPVKDASQTLRRLGHEQGLSDGIISDMEDRLPGLVTSTTDTNIFEIVNVLTNQANHEDFRSKASQRRNLQRGGGAIAMSHSERCSKCYSTLVN